MSALAGCLARTTAAERYPLAPGFPQLYSVELKKQHLVMQQDSALTGLASPAAEKAGGGSQLLLDV